MASSLRPILADGAALPDIVQKSLAQDRNMPRLLSGDGTIDGKLAEAGASSMKGVISVLLVRYVLDSWGRC